MDSTFTAILASWSFAPWPALCLGLAAIVYTRGWWRLRQRGTRQFQAQQLAFFYAGLGTVYMALMSPLDALAPLLMSAHMAQHLLLMLVAPPLIWLAAPEGPLIAGLPAAARRAWIMPLWQLSAARQLAARLTRPATAWTLAVVFLWLWHIPVLYQWALQDRWMHDFEHASFLMSSLLFWFPVVSPYPHRRTYSVWLLLPYLFLAGIQGSVLSGILTFADHVLYPRYEQVPHLWGISALADQAIGGALMWTLGSLAYLIPLVLVGRALLKSGSANASSLPRFSAAPFCSTMPAGWGLATAGANLAASSVPCQHFEPGRRAGDTAAIVNQCRGAGSGEGLTFAAASMLPVLAEEPGCKGCSQPWDLLRIPVVGAVLRRAATRRAMQCVSLAAAVVIVIDGLRGPQLAPVNVAGVVPWIHWRWLLVLGLLAAGNVFCMACPFTLFQRFTQAWLPARWTWPRWLSNKGPAIALLLLFFWAYELFALWNSPWWTGWIVLGYFAAALMVNGLFRGAPFCRYICPIGQFNFVYSLVSPLEVQVRDPQVCQSCRTHACLRGSAALPGCEMGLFQPHKEGNFDCTFCLDCVRSCPHDNVGLIAGLPAASLATSQRLDGGRNVPRGSVLVLLMVLSSAAILSAAWMTSIGAVLSDGAAEFLGEWAHPALVSVGTILGLLVVPGLALALVASFSQYAAGAAGSWRRNIAHYLPALIPLSLGIWGAHYTYHLLAGAGTVVSAVGRFAEEYGWLAASSSSWTCPCCAGELAPWMLPAQFFLLDLGLLTSLYVAYVVARNEYGRTRTAWAVAAPWGCLILGLFVCSVLLLLEPMQMRGTWAAWPGGGA